MTFLGLVSLESGTAAAITEALPAFLAEQKLDPTKCVGPATDGCNAMVGAHNWVATKFKEVNPDFVHIRCVSRVPLPSARRIVRDKEVAATFGISCG